MRKVVSCLVSVAMLFSSVSGYAQGVFLPQPGVMVGTSASFSPVMLRGLKADPAEPLLFDFLIDNGNTGLDLQGEDFRAESAKLIKYFLGALTIPEDGLWVNLSPFEKDRMMTPDLEKTVLGRDMLAQDYILKQITASLIHPDKELGKAFWSKVYARAKETFGTADIPVDTFNKVWITADRAKVLERNSAGYVVNSHLKVLLEADYLAAQKQGAGSREQGTEFDGNSMPNISASQDIAKSVLREVVIPALEAEVNTGANFAPLRQIFHAMILASWYKQSLKEALLTRGYANRGKTDGIGYEQGPEFNGNSMPEVANSPDAIYQRYLSAYKTGVFNLIKEEDDPLTGEAFPRKYFSGGVNPGLAVRPERVSLLGPGDRMGHEGAMAAVRTRLAESAIEQAGQPTWDVPIRSMIQKKYEFVGEKMDEGGFVYRAVNGGLLEGLISGAFTYQSPHTPSTERDPSERKLGIYYVSHFLGEAMMFWGDWGERSALNSGVLVIPGRFFNEEVHKGSAAIHKNRDHLYRFPFFTKPLPTEQASYIIVHQRLKDYIDTVKAGSRKLTSKETTLREALLREGAPQIVARPARFQTLEKYRGYLQEKTGKYFSDNPGLVSPLFPQAESAMDSGVLAMGAPENIVRAFFGEETDPQVPTVTKTRIYQQTSGSGLVTVTSRGRQANFSISRWKMEDYRVLFPEKGLAGEAAAVVIEDHPRRGKRINVYLAGEYEKYRLAQGARPVALASYQHPQANDRIMQIPRKAHNALKVDPVGQDVSDYLAGEVFEPEAGETTAGIIRRTSSESGFLAVLKDHRAVQDVHELNLFRRVKEVYQGRHMPQEARVSFSEDPDYGRYVLVKDPVSGRAVSNYYRDAELGAAFRVDFGERALIDHVLGRANVKGEPVTLRSYVHDLPVLENGRVLLWAGTRKGPKRRLEIRGLTEMAGQVPAFIPGDIIDGRQMIYVYDAGAYAKDPRIRPNYILVRDASRSQLRVLFNPVHRYSLKTFTRQIEMRRRSFPDDRPFLADVEKKLQDWGLTGNGLYRLIGILRDMPSDTIAQISVGDVLQKAGISARDWLKIRRLNPDFHLKAFIRERSGQAAEHRLHLLRQKNEEVRRRFQEADEKGREELFAEAARKIGLSPQELLAYRSGLSRGISADELEGLEEDGLWGGKDEEELLDEGTEQAMANLSHPGGGEGFGAQELVEEGRQELASGKYWVGNELIRFGRAVELIEKGIGGSVFKENFSVRDLAAVIRVMTKGWYSLKEVRLFAAQIRKCCRMIREGKTREELLLALKEEYRSIHAPENMPDPGLRQISDYQTGTYHQEIAAALKALGVPVFFVFDLDLTLTKADPDNFNHLVRSLEQNPDSFVGVTTHRPFVYESTEKPDDLIASCDGFFNRQMRMLGLEYDKHDFFIGLVMELLPSDSEVPTTYSGANYFWFVRTTDRSGKIRKTIVETGASYEGTNKVAGLGGLVAHFRDSLAEEKGIPLDAAERQARAFLHRSVLIALDDDTDHVHLPISGIPVTDKQIGLIGPYAQTTHENGLSELFRVGRVIIDTVPEPWDQQQKNKVFKFEKDVLDGLQAVKADPRRGRHTVNLRIKAHRIIHEQAGNGESAMGIPAGSDPVFENTFGRASSAMMSWLLRQLRYFTIAYLMTGAFKVSAAQYRSWLTESGQQRMRVVSEEGDDWGSVMRGLARIKGLNLTDEQVLLVMREFFKENNISLENDLLEMASHTVAKGQTFEAWEAYSWADLFGKLNNAQIMDSAKIENPGQRTISVDFVKYAHSDGLGQAAGIFFQVPGKIWINMGNILNWADHIQRNDLGPQHVFHGLYPGRESRDIAKAYAGEVLFHEYIHILTTQLIRSQAFQERLTDLTRGRTGDPYRIVEEVAAFLGQFYFSAEPRLYLRILKDNVKDNGARNGDNYFSAASIVISRLADKHVGIKGMIDIETQRIGRPLSDHERLEAERKYVQGDYLKNKEDLSSVISLLGQVPVDQFNNGAKEIFKEIFGMDPPDKAVIRIPDSVLPPRKTLSSETEGQKGEPAMASSTPGVEKVFGVPDYPLLQQQVREALRQQGPAGEYLRPLDFFLQSFYKDRRSLPEGPKTLVFSDHLDVDSFVSTLTMSYLLHVMMASTGRAHIPVIPVFSGSLAEMDPSVASILDLVFPGDGARILQSLTFVSDAEAIRDPGEDTTLVQVDSSGYRTWLTVDHHKEKRNTQAGPGSRIIPGASAAFLISQEYHKLREAGFAMPRKIAWLTLYSIMSDTVFFSENMIGDDLYRGVNRLLLPVIGKQENDLADIFKGFREAAYNITKETPQGALRDTKSYEVGAHEVLVTQRFFYNRERFFELLPGIVRQMERSLPQTGKKVWFFIGTDVDERTSYVIPVILVGQVSEAAVRQVLDTGVGKSQETGGVRMHLRPEMLRKQLMESIAPLLDTVLQGSELSREVGSGREDPETFETSGGIIQYAQKHRWDEYTWAGTIRDHYDEKYRDQFVRALQFLLKHIDPALREGAAWICAQKEWIGPVDIPLTAGWDDRSLLKVLEASHIVDQNELLRQLGDWYADLLLEVEAEGKTDVRELLHAQILGVFRNEAVERTPAFRRAEKMLHLMASMDKDRAERAMANLRHPGGGEGFEDLLRSYAPGMAAKIRLYRENKRDGLTPDIERRLERVEDRIRRIDSLQSFLEAVHVRAYCGDDISDVTWRLKAALFSRGGMQAIEQDFNRVFVSLAEKVMRTHAGDVRVGFLRDDLEAAVTIEQVFSVLLEHFGSFLDLPGFFIEPQDFSPRSPRERARLELPMHQDLLKDDILQDRQEMAMANDLSTEDGENPSIRRTSGPAEVSLEMGDIHLQQGYRKTRLGFSTIGDSLFRVGVFEAPQKGLERVIWSSVFGDMMTYASGGQWRGVLIPEDTSFRGQGILRYLLSGFFEVYPGIREVSPLARNVAALKILQEDFGFRPVSEDHHRIWIRKDGDGHQVYFESEADERAFFDGTGEVINITRDYRFLSDAPPSFDPRVEGFSPVVFGVLLRLADEEKFRQACLRYSAQLDLRAGAVPLERAMSVRPPGFPGLVFDIGGVIFDHDFDRLARALIERGSRETDPARVIEIFIQSDFYKDFEKGRSGPGRYHQELLTALGIDEGRLSFDDFVGLWNGIFTLKPETVELLRREKQAGRKIFFLTDTNPLHFEYLLTRNPEVFALADQVFTSYGLGLRKGDGGDVFRAMTRQISHEHGIDPDGLLFFDDRQENVQRAEEAGLLAAVFRRAQEASGQIRNASDLQDAARTTAFSIWREALQEIPLEDITDRLISGNREAHLSLRVVLADKLARALGEQFFGVRRVWLYGSVDRGLPEDVGPGSDIDLIIEVRDDADLFSVDAFLRGMDGVFTGLFQDKLGIEILYLVDATKGEKILTSKGIRAGQGVAGSILNVRDRVASTLFDRDRDGSRMSDDRSLPKIESGLESEPPLLRAYAAFERIYSAYKNISNGSANHLFAGDVQILLSSLDLALKGDGTLLLEIPQSLRAIEQILDELSPESEWIKKILTSMDKTSSVYLAVKEITEDGALFDRLMLFREVFLSNVKEIRDAVKAYGREAAMAPGGIDLNANKMVLDVEKENLLHPRGGEGFMPEEFRTGDFSGLVPVILKVTPIASPLPILGLSEKDLTPVAGAESTQPVACLRREEELLLV